MDVQIASGFSFHALFLLNTFFSAPDIVPYNMMVPFKNVCGKWKVRALQGHTGIRM